MSYISTILAEFPQESQAGMLRLAEPLEQSLRKQLAVRREDVDALRADIRDLAAAQQRIEERLDRLAGIVERLAEAQERTGRELRSLIGTMEKLADEHQETRRQLGVSP